MSILEGYEFAALLAVLVERGMRVKRNSEGRDKLQEETPSSTLLASIRSLRASVCLVTALVSASRFCSRRRRWGISIADKTRRSAIVGTKSIGIALDVAARKSSIGLGSALSMQCESYCRKHKPRFTESIENEKDSQAGPEQPNIIVTRLDCEKTLELEL